MKSPFPISSIVMIVCSVLLFLVQEWILALVFGAVGVLMLFDKPKSKGVQRKANASKSTAVKSKTTTKKTMSTSVVSGAPAADAYAYNGSVQDYFDALLRNAFPDYELVRGNDLKANTVGTASWECACGAVNTGKFCTECGAAKPEQKIWTCKCGSHNTGKFCPNCGATKPIAGNTSALSGLTFALRKNGQVKLGIILCGKKEWTSAPVLKTMDACKTAGIPCLSFYNEFRNEAGYAVDRIKKALR